MLSGCSFSSEILSDHSAPADPLTGQALQYPGERATAVVIDNAPASTVQWGIGSASVVLEAQTEADAPTSLCLAYPAVSAMPTVGPVTLGQDLYWRTFGPTFRAEKSFPTRHAAEFWMIEPEMAFFNQFIDQGLIERLELVANSEFGRITYTDAIEVLKKNNKKFQFPVEWGVDIQTEHERYLTEVVFKKPVFVTDYPKEIKSFYMKQNPDGKTVAAADMLVPGIGELIGGSQREEDYDKLVARMDELGLDKSSYDWYLNLRKFGGVEHAGYGLGFERMIMYLTGIQNIRDVLPFPRTAYGF